MAVTTLEQEIARLRKYLTPYIKGPNTDAVLEALALGNATYLVNSVAAVHDQLFVSTASEGYLDGLLAAYGITRPPAVGLSDDVYREIGIEVKNRKQVRDLINNILFQIFGEDFVNAENAARKFEPYDLNDGDTLIINFDDNHTIPIEFNTASFQNIHAATAQEVADVISETLQILGLTGRAEARNDGNGSYVIIASDTIGPQSSVTVLGGRAENVLLFDMPVPAVGDFSTQWTLTLVPGGFIRFTWTGGADPSVGRVSVGNYVNVYGGGFTANPENEGTFTVTKVKGGVAGQAFFEVSNPLGTAHIVVQGNNSAVLFYDPVRESIASKTTYATVYQAQARVLQVFLPASTKVIKRTRIGSAHLHDNPRGVFTFLTNPNSGDQFMITTTSTLIAGADFAIGATPADTALNLANAINTLPVINAIAGQDDQHNVIVTIYQNQLPMTILVTYSGSASVTGSGLLGDPLSLEPNQQGPYVFDLAQPFVVSDVGAKLTADVDGTMSRVISVDNSANFPDQQGYLIFEYGWENQEGPVPYIARPSNSTLLLSPAYTLKNEHPDGSLVSLVAQRGSAQISQDGLDYPFYVTDTVSGRIYAQDLINQVVATGINVVFTILYPGDQGLGKAGTPTSEISYVWGS